MIAAHQKALQALSLILTLAACSQTAPTQGTSPQVAAAISAAQTEQYLARIASEPGVRKLSDEVYVKTVRQGYGCKPTATSQVLAHYEARLSDGKVVDSSIARGKPMTLPLPNTIKAWRLAVPQMTEGSTWEIYTHPAAAYGERGSPPTIPPAAPMAFTISLIKAGTCQLQ